MLAAKQAATLDVLSNGALARGHWDWLDALEYTALNEDFPLTRKTRRRAGAGDARTVDLPTGYISGTLAHPADVGISRFRCNSPFPIWFGGQAEAALARMARLADGWMTNYRTAAEGCPCHRDDSTQPGGDQAPTRTVWHRGAYPLRRWQP